MEIKREIGETRDIGEIGEIMERDYEDCRYGRD